MNDFIGLLCAAFAIGFLWLAVMQARATLPRGCPIDWWDVDERIVLTIIFTALIAFTGVIPWVMPEKGGSDALFVNAVWFTWTAWAAITFAIMGAVAKRWSWTREGKSHAFVLVGAFPVFATAMMMGIVKATQ